MLYQSQSQKVILFTMNLHPGELKMPKQLIHKEQTQSSASAITKYHALGGLSYRH